MIDSYETGYDRHIKSQVAPFSLLIFGSEFGGALDNEFCDENMSIAQTSEEDREPTSIHH